MSKVSVQTPSVWHPSQHWRISRGKSMAGVGAKTPLLTASLTGNLPLSKKAHTDVIPALCVCASILFKLQNQKVNKDNDQLSRTCHKAGVCVCVWFWSHMHDTDTSQCLLKPHPQVFNRLQRLQLMKVLRVTTRTSLSGRRHCKLYPTKCHYKPPLGLVNNVACMCPQCTPGYILNLKICFVRYSSAKLLPLNVATVVTVNADARRHHPRPQVRSQRKLPLCKGWRNFLVSNLLCRVHVGKNST